ncbi:MAG: hypothetical protein ABIN01_25790 [Ferruginibacter sp.]
MKKPRTIRDRGFWLYAVQQHRGVSAFVKLIRNIPVDFKPFFRWAGREARMLSS